MQNNRWIPWRLGLDVGVSGALVAFNTDTKELRIFDPPYTKRALVKPTGKHKWRSIPNAEAWLELLEPFVGAYLIVEDIDAYSTGYTSSEVAVNRAFGTWLACCAAKRIEVETVHPKTWKAFMHQANGGSKAEKSSSVELARRLFPTCAPMITASKDGRAEALLLLYYGLLGEPQRFKLKAESRKQAIQFEPVATLLSPGTADSRLVLP